MIPPKTLNSLYSSQRLRRFRDCPSLSTLPYATHSNAHQITLAAEILSEALYWRAARFHTLKRSSKLTVKPIPSSTASPARPTPDPIPLSPIPLSQTLDISGEEQ